MSRSRLQKYKKQHFVPQSYLKAWADPSTPSSQEPYVWVIHKRELRLERRAPRNIFHSTDLYTIPKADGSRDLSLEHGLSQLESDFAQVRSSKLEPQLPLTPHDRLVLCAFIAAMYARTTASAQRSRPIWDELLRTMERMAAWAETASPEERKRAAEMARIDPDEGHIVSIEGIRSITDNPIPSLLAPFISAATPLLFKLDMAILTTSTKPGYLTSDDPCVWFDPEGYKRPWPRQGPALMYPSIEISMPVSPSQAILLNRKGNRGYLRQADFGPAADIGVVAEANWRTARAADKSVIACRGNVMWSWFFPAPHGTTIRFRAI